jgi:hypothetical protein
MKNLTKIKNKINKTKMKNINKKTIILTSILLLGLPSGVQAAMQSLNGLGGQNQTFTNETNIGVSSSGTTHLFTWSGLLSPSRGGAGVNLSSFATGSIMFWDGSSMAEDPALLWDNENDQLRLGNNLSLHNGAYIEFFAGGSGDLTGQFATNVLGHYLFGAPGGFASLDFTNATNSEQFIFPGTYPITSSTISLLETDQVFSGLNKFEATTNSTIYVGSSIKSGCIALGDSDDSGITYIIANDGVLSATSTKPSICQ